MHRIAGTSVGAAGLATRERIIESALALFLRDGYEATSIRAIARDASLSDATIHYHFHSKQDLLSAVIESRAALAAVGTRHPGTCVTRQCLVDCILDHFYTYVALPDLISILLREQIVNEPTCVASGIRLANHFIQKLGPAFERLFGDRGCLLRDALDMLLCGVLWHELLQSRTDFQHVVASSVFRKRVRGLVDLALPAIPVPAAAS